MIRILLEAFAELDFVLAETGNVDLTSENITLAKRIVYSFSGDVRSRGARNETGFVKTFKGDAIRRR